MLKYMSCHVVRRMKDGHVSGPKMAPNGGQIGQIEGRKAVVQQDGGCSTAEVQEPAIESSPASSPSRANGIADINGEGSVPSESSLPADEVGVSAIHSGRSADDRRGRTSPLMAGDESPARSNSKSTPADGGGQKQQQQQSSSSQSRRNESKRTRRRHRSLLPPRSPPPPSQYEEELDDPRVAASELSQRLELASTELVDNLFEFISACRQGSDISGVTGRNDQQRHRNAHTHHNSGSSRSGSKSNKKRKKKKMGLTLPASAIGWLSSRMDPQPGDEGGEYQFHAGQSRGGRGSSSSRGGRRRGQSRSNTSNNSASRQSSSDSMQLSERLALLRFHLPQSVEHLRITNEEWPPLPRPDYDDISAAGRRDASSGGRSSRTASSGLPRLSSPKKDINNTPSSTDRGRSILARYYIAAGATSQDGEQSALEEVLAGRYSHSRQNQAAIQFLVYWHNLQHRPRLDMAIFANVKVLITDGVLPECIMNMHLVRKSLEILRVERASVYDVPSFLFPCVSSNNGRVVPTLADAGEAASEKDVSTAGALVGEQLLRSTTADDALSHVANLDLNRFDATEADEDMTVVDSGGKYYQSLTHLKLSYCAIGESSGLDSEEKGIAHDRADDVEDVRNNLLQQPPFARMPNLESLNLSHNEIVRATTACAGLKGLPKLSALDLSFNRLQSMTNAFLILGNVKTLVLSWNDLSSVDGLERMYSLERLALDHNRIGYLQDLAGLASLPELMYLEMRGNPIEVNDLRFRVNILNVFKERRLSLLPRGATFRQLQEILPTLDGQSATPSELLSLKEMTFVPFLVTSASAAEQTAYVVENDGSSDAPVAHEDFPSFSPLTSQGNGESLSIAASTCRIRRCVPTRKVNIRNSLSGAAGISGRVGDRKKAAAAAARKRLSNGTSQSPRSFSIEDVISTLVPRAHPEEVQDEDEEEAFVDAESSVGSDSEMDDDATSVLQQDIDQADADDDSFMSAASHTVEESAAPMAGVSDVVQPLETDDSLLQPDEDKATQRGKKTVKISDTSKASESDAIERDGEPTAGDHYASFQSLLGGSDHESAHSDGGQNGAEAVASPAVIKQQQYNFGSAEKNAVYDGSDSYSDLSVLSYLHLYFQTFVFPPTLEKGSSFYEEETDKIEREANYTRIQLFHSDRELATRAPENGSNGPRVPIQEKFVDVWRDEIMACGLASTSRLPPVEESLRGFHGDVVRNRGIEETVGESQSVLLCLSDSALYFMPDFQVASSDADEDQERRFPSPLPRNALFKDACWPHALARHPLEYLQRITIGFQFQRLVLHFVLPKRSTQSREFEYAYVAFTCNKLRTISLVQKLQAQKKALHFTNNGGEEALIIDNDDRVVLDSLADAIAPTPMGVVLHYQVLRQKWKHQRLDGTDPEVRRVCVLTDSNIFLLDENYVGDGSTTTLTGKGKYGDAILSLVDAADLAQVTKIRAADEDPEHITLVVQAKSRLMRSHRWRLVCKDGESAERLIDEVRKAVAAL